VANEIDSVFIHVDAASIMSKWLGESEKNVAKVFNTARELSKKEDKVVHNIHRRARRSPGNVQH